MRFLCLVSVVAISAVVAFVPSRPPVSLAHRSSSSVLFSTTSTDVAGTVKWYNAERGFGFIEVDDGGPDMYVHATGLTCDGPLVENERVSFATEIDRRTNKPKAVNVVRSTSIDADATATTVGNEPDSEPTKLNLQNAMKAESFQRARLDAQLKQAAKDAHVKKAAAEKRLDEEAAALAEATRLVKEAEEKRIAEEAAAKAAAEAEAARLAKEAAEKRIAEEAAAEAEAARLAKEAEEKRIAEEAAAKAAAEAEAARLAKEAEEKRVAGEAAAKAAAEAEAARLAKEAEEKRIAEEAAARAAEEIAARELGYPSVVIMNARQQPKSPEVEAALAAKYAAMNLEERAFTILSVSDVSFGFVLFTTLLSRL